MQKRAIGLVSEGTMDLEFVGIDPNTEHEGSPTVWVDKEERELVFQGWECGAELIEHISSTSWAEGHAPGIPQGEGVFRIPARMIPIIRKACDDAERAGLL
ncbi:hypothetical protein P3T39_006838 [Kitasatospora sp. GP82]|nr:hypothetical protein [Kitasatospora sp. GP82]